MSKKSTDCKKAGRLQSPDSTCIRWMKQLSEDLFTMLIARLWDHVCFSPPADLTNLVSVGALRLSQQCCCSFCDVMPYQLVDSYHDFRWSECPVRQGQLVHIYYRRTLLYDCLTLKMKGQYTYRMPVTVYHLIQHNIPQDLDLQQHCSENLKSHKQHPPLGLVLKQLIIVSGCIMQLKFHHFPIGYVPRPGCAM